MERSRSRGLLAAALALALAVGPSEPQSSCVNYGEACVSGTLSCCYTPLVMCMLNNNNQMACLSPLDMNKLSPLVTSSPFYSSVTGAVSNFTKKFANILPPAMSAQLTEALAPPSG